jgi:hypothetical protein
MAGERTAETAHGARTPAGPVPGALVERPIEALPARLVVLALGLNLWLTGLVVPTVAARAWDLVPLAIMAPLLCAVGLLQRSPPALLVGVPLAALLPLGLPELAAVRRDVWPFVVLAPGLAAYLYSALRLSAHAEAPTEMGRSVALTKRASRTGGPGLVRALAVTLVAVPAVLLLAALAAPATGPSVRAVEGARTLTVAAAALLSSAVYALAVRGPLGAYLAGPQRPSVAPARLGRSPAFVVLLVVLAVIALGSLVLWGVALEAYWRDR